MVDFLNKRCVDIERVFFNYVETKSRLLRSGIRNVFYIIEEIDGHSVNQFGRDALRSAMATVQTFSGFHVKRTINADDTVRLLASLTEYIQQRYLAVSQSSLSLGQC